MSNEGIAYTFHRGLLAKPSCDGCPLQGSKIVPPEGNPHAKIAIVGEGPGYVEEVEGRLYCGSTGQLLNKLLSQAEIEREAVWLTNSTLCKPKVCIVDGKPMAPDSVVRLAAKFCKSRLDAELAIVRPRVVIGFGAQSVRSVYSSAGNMKGRRGGIHTIDLLQTKTDLVEEEEDDNDEDVELNPADKL